MELHKTSPIDNERNIPRVKSGEGEENIYTKIQLKNNTKPKLLIVENPRWMCEHDRYALEKNVLVNRSFVLHPLLEGRGKPGSPSLRVLKGKICVE